MSKVAIVTDTTAYIPDELVEKHKGDENEDIEVMTIPLKGYQDALKALGTGGTTVDLRIYGLIELATRSAKG